MMRRLFRKRGWNKNRNERPHRKCNGCKNQVHEMSKGRIAATCMEIRTRQWNKNSHGQQSGERRTEARNRKSLQTITEESEEQKCHHIRQNKGIDPLPESGSSGLAERNPNSTNGVKLPLNEIFSIHLHINKFMPNLS